MCAHSIICKTEKLELTECPAYEGLVRWIMAQPRCRIQHHVDKDEVGLQVLTMEEAHDMLSEKIVAYVCAGIAWFF